MLCEELIFIAAGYFVYHPAFVDVGKNASGCMSDVVQHKA